MRGGVRVGCSGFTLLEVMVAMFLFFMAVFAILDATNQALRAARGLQVKLPEVGTLAADLFLTNRIEEGEASGDFGELYPDFQWVRTIYERETNGLYQVDFTITWVVAGRSIITTNSLLLWRPAPTGAMPSRRVRPR